MLLSQVVRGTEIIMIFCERQDNMKKRIIFYLGVMFLIFLSASVQSTDTLYTYIPSNGIGNIALQIEYPARPRYPEGAPVVVEVSTWFVPNNRFHRVNDTKRIGAVTISYLWPGRLDAVTGMQSEGEYDTGGPVSLQALKDVIRFAHGVQPDINGQTISDLMPFPLLTDNIGLFASSHAGVVATNVLAYFGEQIPFVKYLVGRENPTRDEMYPLEIGHFDGSSTEANKVINSFFREDIYAPDTVIVDYSTLGWYQPHPDSIGRPYFAAKDEIPEHIMAPDKFPQIGNKRYYSRALTRALLANGAFTLATWPHYLATPAQTDSIWPYRIAVHNYPAIGAKLPDLKVMLVFSRYDHVQAARTKPHIRQAWDGFRQGCGFWVRMNPDKSYVQSLDPGYGPGFPDNPANREPLDWIFIEDWGFPADPIVRDHVWMASVAEMADRVYMNNWDDNLDEAFFPVIMDTATTGIQEAVAEITVPDQYILKQNAPNPFNPSTVIPFSIPKQGRVILTVYDLTGREVAVLLSQTLSSGPYQIHFNAGTLPAGVYVYRLKAGLFTDTKKFVLLK